jgi:FkbM family methyltransferase
MINIFKYIYFYLQINYKKYRFKKEYYSTSSADALINFIFRNTPKGIYVDVGCNHPIQNNNTYLLHKRGWEGVNIDLDKENIEIFNVARPNDFNLNVAISDSRGTKNVYYFHSSSEINTLNKKTSDSHLTKTKNIFKINTDTLDNIISLSPYKNIDILSIDVEGHELEVLNGFNFNKYQPKLIVIEYLDLSINKLEVKNLDISNVIESTLYKFLTSKNYTLVNWLHSDLFFVHKDFRN